MKKRLFNAIVSFILCLTLCANCFTGVSALSYAQPDGTLSFEKITHPANGSGQNDGIVDYVGNGVISASDARAHAGKAIHGVRQGTADTSTSAPATAH